MYYSHTLGTCYPVWYLHIFLWFLPVFLAFMFNLGSYVIIALTYVPSSLPSPFFLSSLSCTLLTHSLSLDRVLMTFPNKYTYCRIRRTLKLIQSVTPRKARHIYFKFTFYILIYIICWPLDIANNLLRYLSSNNCHLFILTCVYLALLNMQGFLNFLVYGLTNKKIYSQFFGGNPERTLKALLVFLLSPLLLLPISLWALLRTLRGALCPAGSHEAMSMQEVEEQKKAMAARKEREERARRVAQQLKEAEEQQQHHHHHHHHQYHQYHVATGASLQQPPRTLVVNDEEATYHTLTG